MSILYTSERMCKCRPATRRSRVKNDEIMTEPPAEGPGTRTMKVLTRPCKLSPAGSDFSCSLHDVHDVHSLYRRESAFAFCQLARGHCHLASGLHACCRPAPEPGNENQTALANFMTYQTTQRSTSPVHVGERVLRTARTSSGCKYVQNACVVLHR